MASKWRKGGLRRTAAQIVGAIAGAVLAIYVALVGLGGSGVAVDGWIFPIMVVELGCAAALIVIIARRDRPSDRTLIWTGIGFAAVLALSLLGPVLWPKWAPAIAYDGTNPATTGCVDPDTAVIANEWPLTRTGAREVLATVRRMYSPECDTTWLRVLTTDTTMSTEKAIGRPAGDWLLAYTTATVVDPPSDQWTFGDQLHAPGCVTVQVSVLAGGHVVGELTKTCP